MNVGELRFRKDSPVAIANLPGDCGDAFGGHAAHRAQEFRDHGGTFVDDFQQIAGNLPGRHQQRIGVLSQFLSEGPNILLTRRRFLARSILLRLAGFEPDATGDLAERKRRIVLRPRRPPGPQEFTEIEIVAHDVE